MLSPFRRHRKVPGDGFRILTRRGLAAERVIEICVAALLRPEAGEDEENHAARRVAEGVDRLAERLPICGCWQGVEHHATILRKIRKHVKTPTITRGPRHGRTRVAATRTLIKVNGEATVTSAPQWKRLKEEISAKVPRGL